MLDMDGVCEEGAGRERGEEFGHEQDGGLHCPERGLLRDVRSWTSFE